MNKMYQRACWHWQWFPCGISSFSGQMIFWLAQVYESYLVQAYSECPLAILWALTLSTITSPPDQQYSHQWVNCEQPAGLFPHLSPHLNHCEESVGHCLDLRLGLIFFFLILAYSWPQLPRKCLLLRSWAQSTLSLVLGITCKVPSQDF